MARSVYRHPRTVEKTLSTFLAVSLAVTFCFPAAYAFGDEGVDAFDDSVELAVGGTEDDGGVSDLPSENQTGNDVVIEGDEEDLPETLSEPDGAIQSAGDEVEELFDMPANGSLNEAGTDEYEGLLEKDVDADGLETDAILSKTDTLLSTQAASNTFQYKDSYNVTWTYTYTATSKKATVTAVSGYSDTLVIPGTIPHTTGTGDNATTTNLSVEIKAGSKTGGIYFGNLEGVSKLVFEDGVTVKSNDLKDCKAQTIEIGNNVNFSGGGWALSGANATNTNVRSVTVGANVSCKNDRLFQNCTELTTATTSTVVANMFYGCSKLETLTLNGVDMREIPEGAFKNVPASSLESYSFNDATSIGKNSFSGTKLKGQLDIPATVTTIGSNAFEKTNITSVTVGSNVDKLEKTFMSCSSLKSATIDVREIGTQVFKDTTALATLHIGPNVSVINKLAFENAKEGLSITVDQGNSHVILNEGILYCDGVQVYPYVATQETPTEINASNAYKFISNGSLIVPSTIASIQPEGLSYSSVSVDEGNPYFRAVDDVLYTSDMKTLVRAPKGRASLSVPEGVESIGNYAFVNTNFASVRLPSTLANIGDCAFMNCGGLANVNLPEGCKTLGKWAFAGCTSLEALALPDSLADIGAGAFASTQMGSFTATPSLWGSDAQKNEIGLFDADAVSDMILMLWYDRESPDQMYKRIQDGTTTLNTRVTQLDFSSYSATFIPPYAFGGLGGLTELTLPSNIRDIGYGSFFMCDNLADVYVYSPTLINIAGAGTTSGTADSGGDSTEIVPKTNASAFATWDETIRGDGKKFVERSGIRFYGNAHSLNNLIKYCNDNNQVFVPVVTLQELSAAENPFSSSAAAYTLTYGEDEYDYCNVSIDDIALGGTPKVFATFGYWDGTRDLTNDDACEIVYCDPDGNVVTSFGKEGEYTAYVSGDGKSVFGARTLKFYVGDRPSEAEEEEPATEETEKGADTEQANTSTTAATETKQAAAQTVYQTVYQTATTAAPAAVQQENANVYPVDADGSSVADVLSKFIGSAETAIFWGGDNAAAPLYVWQVPGSAITEANAKTLDLHVVDRTKAGALSQRLGNLDYTAFEARQSGAFPKGLTLYWKTSSTFYDGAKVDVYRYTGSDGGSVTRGMPAMTSVAGAHVMNTPLVQVAYADTGYAAASGDVNADEFELVKSGLVVTDGYVSLELDQGGVYVVTEAGTDLASAVSGAFVETAYADAGDAVNEGAPARSKSPAWVLQIVAAAVVAAIAGVGGGLFVRRKNRAKESASFGSGNE